MLKLMLTVDQTPDGVCYMSNSSSFYIELYH